MYWSRVRVFFVILILNCCCCICIYTPRLITPSSADGTFFFHFILILNRVKCTYRVVTLCYLHLCCNCFLLAVTVFCSPLCCDNFWAIMYGTRAILAFDLSLTFCFLFLSLTVLLVGVIFYKTWFVQSEMVRVLFSQKELTAHQYICTLLFFLYTQK